MTATARKPRSQSSDSVMMRAGHPSMLDAIVIGAGFAGLYQLHKLRDALGLDVTVLEAGGDIGGTWYWNRYPGARCDSESHAYCYAFSETVNEGWTFSERYPGQAEILRYLSFVADKLDLRRDIRLSTRVTSARFDEAANVWHVTTEAGETLRARFLIAAVGCLSSANIPRIPGLETFAGRSLHTGAWPHEPVDFSGLRVAQIGTGSTGIQAAPVIAGTAAHLTVFQRTANYSVPARNAPLTPAQQAYYKRNFAETRAIMHKAHNGHAFLLAERDAHDVSAAERQTLYEKAWEVGGLQFRAVFRDMLSSQASNDTAAEFLKAKIREIVKEPATAAALADIDHPYAAKRPPIDTDYFETFNRPNVTLVDLKRTPIEAITPKGIRTSAGEHPVDMIVFATGFDAMTGSLLKIDIRGREGRTLRDAWAAGPRTYLGLQVAGFPNLFTVTGPGSPSVLTNMPVAIEQHVDWIADCIAHCRATGIERIEATAAAQDEWVAEVNRAANATLMPKAHHSWYLGANVPGKPRVFMPYPGGMPRYREICASAAREGYRGFVLA